MALRRRVFLSVLVAVLGVASLLPLRVAPASAASTLTVCSSGCAYKAIQQAIHASVAGDTILVSPGTYVGALTLDKGVHLLSRSYDEADPRNNTTVIDGNQAKAVITIPSGVAPPPTITGFVIRNGRSDGISPHSPFEIQYCYLTGASDLIDYEEGSGGLLQHSVFESAGDDAVDLDHPNVDLLIEGNRLLSSGDDGIEIRLQDDVLAQQAVTTIRNNEIRGSDQDGIQLIDYGTDTNRRFVIERNLITGSGQAAIGLMDDATTTEDLRAASIREPIDVVGNTIVDNHAGISGGDNLVAVNNIVARSTLFGLKNVDGSSRASHNLLHANSPDLSGTNNVDAATTLQTDPFLTTDFRLQAGSPAIDAGTASFEWNGRTIVDLTSMEYLGTAPDLGMYESDGAPPDDRAPTAALTLTPTSGSAPLEVTADASASADPDGDIATYAFDWGDGATTPAQVSPIATHTYSAAGTYVVTLTVTDSGGRTGSAQASVTVGTAPPPGEAPVIDAVTIDPAAPLTNDTMTATVTASDPDGDPLTYSYEWIRNGTAIAGATSPSLDLSIAGHGDKGDAIAVTVTASDGTATSDPVTSPAVTIANSPPAFDQDLGDRTSTEGATISLSAAATDPDGDPLTYAATGLPTGLSIDTATGLISGTIAAGATTDSPYAVSVTVREGTTVDTTDTFTWTVISPARIEFRSASSTTARDATRIDVPRPPGAQTGDVLVAAVDVRGTPNLTAPSGWTLVRLDSNGSVMRQAVYTHLVTAGEPAVYTWTFSVGTPSAGAIILAYTGVDTAVPVDVSSGQANPASSRDITAPSLTPTVPDARLVGFFGMANNPGITEPTGMVERAEVVQNAGRDKITLETADQVLGAVAVTGERVATTNQTGENIGQLVALRPQR